MFVCDRGRVGAHLHERRRSVANALQHKSGALHWTQLLVKRAQVCTHPHTGGTMGMLLGREGAGGNGGAGGTAITTHRGSSYLKQLFGKYRTPLIPDTSIVLAAVLV